MLVILILCGFSLLWSQPKFRIYGFTDASYSKAYYDNDHFLQQRVNDLNHNFAVDHFNLYFNFTPSSQTRTLLEIAFFSQNEFSASQHQTKFRSLDFSQIQWNQLSSIATLPESQQAFATTQIQQGLNSFSQEVSQKQITSFEQEEGGFFPEIKRAFMEYLYSESFNIRIGKFITPAGLWNVDHASPLLLTIAQPQQVSFIPIFPESQSGLMLHGQAMSSLADWNYNLYVSAGRDKVDKEKLNDFGVGGKLSLELASLKIGTSFYHGTQKEIKKALSINVQLNTEDANNILQQQNTLQSATSSLQEKQQASESIENTLEIASQRTGLDQIQFENTLLYENQETAIGIDFTWSWNNLTLRAEKNYRYLLNSQDENSEIHASYIMFDYLQALPNEFAIQPYLFWEQMSWQRVENNPVLGIHLFPVDSWQSFMTGFNIHITPQFIWKIGYTHYILNPDNNATEYRNATSYTQDDLKLHLIQSQWTMSF